MALVKASIPPSGEPAEASALNARIGRLSVRHLQLLDQIEKRGSLSAAATGVGVSQPRATHMLRDMEGALGCVLLDRTSRGARLNAAGSIALERLRIALGALDATQMALRHASPRLLVRIGVLPLVGTDRLCRVVAGLEADGMLPRVILRVGTVRELLELLEAGEVDCVISSLDITGSAPSTRARLQTCRLWEEHLMVVAARSNPIVRKRNLSLEQLLQHPWALMAGKSANRQALERMFLQAGLQPPQPQVETESPHICLAMVACSRMIALMPESAARQAADRVSPVRLNFRFQPTWNHLITLGDVPVLPFVEQLAQRLIEANR